MSAQFCPASCPFKLLDRKPERLVVTGLRCCVAGYNFGDIEPFPIGLEQSDRVKRLDYIYSGALPYRQSRTTLAGSALDCWETAWKSYCMELGTDDARRLMGELQYWVRMIRSESLRPLDVFPHGCGHVCRDECMALSLIAALQDNDLATAILAARHLAGVIDGEAPLSLATSGQGYADALMSAGQKLMSVPASVVLSIAQFGSGPCPAEETLH